MGNTMMSETVPCLQENGKTLGVQNCHLLTLTQDKMRESA